MPMILLIFLLFNTTIYSIRDPFFFGQSERDANKELICKAVGNINKSKFVLVCYKGKNLTVKIGQKIGDKEVICIEDTFIILKDKNGNKEKVHIE